MASPGIHNRLLVEEKQHLETITSQKKRLKNRLNWLRLQRKGGKQNLVDVHKMSDG